MHPNLSHQDHLTHRRLDNLARGADRGANDGVLHRWMNAAIRQWQRRKMTAALQAMDDRLLRDIGIYRGDIPRVVDSLSDRELRMKPLARSGCPANSYDDFNRRLA